ncbi:hypothetical protein MFRU_007g01250 [Monilinia fructicola]|nr:hypothetical protein MFRU_007g01250 [Monilinia fructicola]
MENMMFISSARINIAATRLIVTLLNRKRDDITLTDTFDVRSAVRLVLAEKNAYKDKKSIYFSNHPSGLEDISALTVSTMNLLCSRADYLSPRASHILIQIFTNLKLMSRQTSNFQLIGALSTDRSSDTQLSPTQVSSNSTKGGYDFEPISVEKQTSHKWYNTDATKPMLNYRDYYWRGVLPIRVVARCQNCRTYD